MAVTGRAIHVQGIDGLEQGAEAEIEATEDEVRISGHVVDSTQLTPARIMQGREIRRRQWLSSAVEDHAYLILGPEHQIILDFARDARLAQLVATACDLLAGGVDIRRRTLRDEKEYLEGRVRKLRGRSRVYSVGGAALIAAGVIGLILHVTPYIGWAMIGYGLMALLFLIANPARIGTLRVQEINQELELLDIAADSEAEARAEKLLRLHRLELDRYYAQIRSQGSVIFFVGVGVILAGFLVIGFAIYQVARTSTTTSQIIVASLGAIGGILANFVAVIFVRMYTEAVKSTIAFHGRLVTTHFLHFGNFLTAKISDQTLRDATLAEVAKVLVSRTEPSNPSVSVQ